MIHEVKSYSGTCDNCGKTFEHWYTGFSIYVDDSSLLEEMDNAEWYLHGQDPDHQDKHYCPNCFKWHPEIDDKIIVDESRKKLNSTPNAEGCDTTGDDSSTAADQIKN